MACSPINLSRFFIEWISSFHVHENSLSYLSYCLFVQYFNMNINSYSIDQNHYIIKLCVFGLPNILNHGSAPDFNQYDPMLSHKKSHYMRHSIPITGGYSSYCAIVLIKRCDSLLNSYTLRMYYGSTLGSSLKKAFVPNHYTTSASFASY